MDRPFHIAIVPASICYAGRNDGDAEWAQDNFFCFLKRTRPNLA
jgi:hypothetical protein